MNTPNPNHQNPNSSNKISSSSGVAAAPQHWISSCATNLFLCGEKEIGDSSKSRRLARGVKLVLVRTGVK